MIWLAWTILALAAIGVAVLGRKSIQQYRETKEMLAQSKRDLAAIAKAVAVTSHADRVREDGSHERPAA